MISHISITRQFRSLPQASVDLKKLTVVVGDQGAGKSTLLSLISGHIKDPGLVKLEHDADGQLAYVYYDFERDNSRVKSHMEDGFGGLFTFASHFASHGETAMSVVGELYRQVRDHPGPLLVLLVEPDTSLSPRSIKILSKTVSEIAAMEGKQVVMSAHNPYLIEDAGDILVLPKLKWRRAKTWLAAQSKSVPEPEQVFSKVK